MAQSISQEAIGATGLPGATAASRHAGATTSGAPTSGTFAVGDFIVDQSGAMYVCTVAGTPGTWVRSGIYGNPAGRIYQSSATTIPNTTFTTLTNMTTDFLKGGMTTGTNTLIVPVSGVYQINACVMSAGSINNMTRWLVTVNANSSQIIQVEQTIPSATTNPTNQVSFTSNLTSGAALSLLTYQQSGGSINSYAGGSWLSATLVSQ